MAFPSEEELACIAICIICVCRCTLIDPRPQKVSKAQRKWLKSFAASQQRHVAAAEVPETNTVLPSSPVWQFPACVPQHTVTGLLEATAAAAASTQGALSAVPPAARLLCSATHPDSAQPQPSAIQADALPDSAQAQAPASEAEVPADTAYTQAPANEAEAHHEGHQGGTACPLQPVSQDEACLLQHSDSQAAAQHKWPDLQGTLSEQLQVRHRPLLVKTLEYFKEAAWRWWQCQHVPPLY